ncbi:hypothetical protein [Acinetobacter brisouii]|uniref:hypothetical protein n=1 Tax=Acinetobacter brisouii TaxID=396323 RepID=UPI0035ADCD00
MRKILSTVVLLCSVQSVFAANDPYIQTVKDMYNLGKKSESGMQVIELYSDASLKQAFNLQARNGEVCGFDHDVMWQSQDPEYNKSLKFDKLGQNKVKVSLGKGKWDHAGTVVYTLKCNGNNCKVSDIQDSGGSVKQNILRECK